EVFFDVCPCYTIGITGSDGKTTTTSIIAEMLKNGGKTVHLGGNIGTPLLTGADEMSADDIAVVEMSSFQLITMKKCPNTAIVTNLTPNHLDVHKDMDEYIGAKRRIFINQKSTDRAIFNLDNEVTLNYSKSAVADEVLMFSRQNKVKNGAYMENDVIYDNRAGDREAIINADEILLPGVHNIENYMAAFAAVRELVSYDVMRETAKTFGGVKHRLEFVRELDGVKFYNDSIASSPTRAIAGLKSFDKKVILIAGGKDKGITFEELGAEISKRVKKLILTGATALQIYEAVISAPREGERPEIILCDDFKCTVKRAYEGADSGDIVLLSPACTSFDRFKNFEERGNVFKELVWKL
ncbi:MAG: UDP-N-acetylmuramoyl-L-alanine--D-glutamate ligase, partial [Oscillospiraceae bacterium]|nr:UDP-N-acetylmuramoyl-L-alanine--D-glutamate ligase [Oscillospiraceae bacterium]